MKNDISPSINSINIHLISVEDLCYPSSYAPLQDSSGTIASLNYPHYYPSFFWCGYIIYKPGVNFTVTLTINHFDLSPPSTSPTCSRNEDYIKVSTLISVVHLGHLTGITQSILTKFGTHI